jgi:dTDP-6-deoxy-L-talose 4-dehydrogenase (NAD+)
VKIAVTGASGFVGRHVLAELAKREVEIVATTRSANNLRAWRDHARIVEMDIGFTSADQLDCLARSDALIHLAWDGLPNYKSRRHFETELPRQYGFLKSLLERGLPALLVTGTCFEYGAQSGALSEDCLALPDNPYGFAKDSLRRQLEFLRCDRSYAMTWARLFYTYGEGQPATSLYPQFMAAMSRGDKSFDMSGGEQLRDYLPIAEVARLIVELAMRREDAGPVNVCAGHPVSVRRLVEGWMRERASDVRLNLGRYPYPDYEPLAFWGARSKLDGLLGHL